jgi:hypothetical protein
LGAWSILVAITSVQGKCGTRDAMACVCLGILGRVAVPLI